MNDIAGLQVSDSVLIEALEIPAVIGIYEWEKSIQQPLVIDVEMAWDNHAAATSGDIADALDYAAVCQALETAVQAQAWGLIEEVAEALAALILNQFGVVAVRLRVAKPTAIKAARTVAVLIERKRSA
ncbi:dihydroneopterin aldolase [Aliidiomarina haloalkalitolerans]|uniref:dihydroneopterin aldolase n=1 Tax=Aliidiomarina haloalkalitolerans TaxID=859059 RepID=UPI001F545166|nr:dihydroneopterin aldolase [Aliidiomarina haloalkalitolerans]